MKITKKTLNDRTVTLYQTETAAPVVFLNMYIQDGRHLLDLCASRGCPPFSLVTLDTIHWDEDLSPWPSAPVVDASDHFTGQAPAYLHWIETSLLDWVESMIPDHKDFVLAGYSMGGLFATWAIWNTTRFQSFVSGSGSLWYPGLLAYCDKRPLPDHPKAVYFSLGSQETKVRNRALQTTRNVTQAICDLLKKAGIDTTFEIVPGNHFVNADIRMADGITWTLSQ